MISNVMIMNDMKTLNRQFKYQFFIISTEAEILNFLLFSFAPLPLGEGSGVRENTAEFMLQNLIKQIRYLHSQHLGHLFQSRQLKFFQCP